MARLGNQPQHGTHARNAARAYVAAGGGGLRQKQPTDAYEAPGRKAQGVAKHAAWMKGMMGYGGVTGAYNAALKRSNAPGFKKKKGM